MGGIAFAVSVVEFEGIFFSFFKQTITLGQEEF